MTTAAICATREFSWLPSFYRGEQYDSDLGLYYLRARYYNPVTGRFMSRDPGKSRKPDATRNDLNSDAKQEVSFYLFGGPASTPASSALKDASTYL